MKKLLLILLCLPMIGFGQCISGDCENGYGTHGLHPEFEKYVGYFKNGLPHGRGTRIENNGEKYDGEWKKGVFWEGSAFDSAGNLLGKKVNGNWE